MFREKIAPVVRGQVVEETVLEGRRRRHSRSRTRDGCANATPKYLIRLSEPRQTVGLVAALVGCGTSTVKRCRGEMSR
jgi:hypothetical protein